MRFTPLFAAAVLGTALLTAPATATKQDKTDHPLVSAYAGSSVYSKDMKKFDEYRLFKGWDKEEKSFITEMLEGRVTRLLYTNPGERSILEIYRNYKAALEQDNAEILFECNQADSRACMDTYVGATLRREFNLHSIGNKEGRYLIAKLEQEEQTAHIALGVGTKHTDIHIVENKKMDTGQVTLNSQALTEGLNKQGFIILSGIFFDTDKTDLKPASNAALEHVATLLEEKPDLKLYVVGHTDTQGSYSYNKTLSEGRAKAVVNALVSQHGIAKDRLKGYGVGPLAPVASNATEIGRELNRRVVLVQQ